MGVPFVPVRGLIGSDLLRVRDDFKVVEDPFHPGEEVVLAPAIRPDVALLHARVADRSGNAVTAPRTNDPILVQAARRVVVTAEEVVEGPLSYRTAPEGTFVPAVYVAAVVPLPWGAHPTPCHGVYGADAAHIREYVAASATPEGFRAYLQRYVYGVRDHGEYLARVGVGAGRRG